MHLPIRLLAGLLQRGSALPPIFVVDENVLAPVAAIHHVVNSSWIFKA